MDPLTQGLLGATCGQALYGRRLGKSAITWGALVGVLPDLDIVATPLAPMAEWLWHRGPTHALWFGLVVGPALGWLIWKAEGRTAVRLARARHRRARHAPAARHLHELRNAAAVAVRAHARRLRRGGDHRPGLHPRARARDLPRSAPGRADDGGTRRGLERARRLLGVPGARARRERARGGDRARAARRRGRATTRESRPTRRCSSSRSAGSSRAAATRCGSGG